MKIVFLGAGNLACHLAKAFFDNGFEICQVFSRTEENAKLLADKIGAAYTNDLGKIYTNADVYFYSLSDEVLPRIISQIKQPEALHIHTSGSTALDVFEGYAQRYGVLYPLQTFSKEKALDFSKIPICIEGSSVKEEKSVSELAKSIAKTVCPLNSEKRKKIHLSAVFVCNFVNYLYAIGAELLEEAGCSFELLLPLIEETAEKIKTLSPYEAQTGPAVRDDKTTMKKHLALLREKESLAHLYRLISEGIYENRLKKNATGEENLV